MTRSVAIVGSGPAGCYLAQALLKARPDLRVDVIDRLAVPYGLVRYGVAPDHQGTKAVSRQFDRLFERQGARFLGNVEVGRDIGLPELRDAYDAVVLAAGLSADRPLGIPGDTLAGVVGAGALTRALCEHPDAGPLPDLGPDVVIVGNGNVAIDLLRLLAKRTGEFDGSDLGEGPTRWLEASGIRTLTIVGRSPASRAKFDTTMIRELARLGGVAIEVDEDPQAPPSSTIEALAALHGTGSGPRRVRFRFGLEPAEIVGAHGRVSTVRFRRPDGSVVEMPASGVLTAIGFAGDGSLDRDALIARACDPEAGVLEPGLYATGWFRRGPRGTIPEHRADAAALATRILTGLPSDEAERGRAGEGLSHLETVDFAGWKRIDAAETASVPEGRCRVKIATRPLMLDAARRTRNPAS